MCFSDRPGSGHICGGKTFGGEKEESRWRAIVNCFRVFFFLCICSKLQNVFLYLMELAPVTFVVEKPLVERKRNPAGEQSWGRE